MVANALNHKGYVTKKGKPFSISSITYILANPFYIGKIQFAKYKDWSEKRRKGLNDKTVIAEGKHSPIINQDLWDKVQMRKNKSVKNPKFMVKERICLQALFTVPNVAHLWQQAIQRIHLKMGPRNVFVTIHVVIFGTRVPKYVRQTV